MKTAIALVVIASAIATAFTRTETRYGESVKQVDLSYTPVSVDAPVSHEMTLPTVYITAKSPKHVKAADGCAFAARDLVQGSGTVRGFCP